MQIRRMVGARRRSVDVVRRVKWLACACATISAVLMISACSSSGSTTNSSAVGGGGVPANVQQAQSVIAAAEVRPTSLQNLPSAIDKPIPTGKTVVFITTGTAASEAEPSILQIATNALHWKLEVIHTDNSAGELQAAWSQILREKPFGVVESGIPLSSFAASVAQAGKEGIYLAANNLYSPLGNGLMYNISYSTAAVGNVMAQWAIANSGNGAPQVLWVALPGIPTLEQLYNGAKASFDRSAPHGSLTSLDIPLADLGTSAATQLLISYLRAHPDVKTVLGSTDSTLIGLPAALNVADISGVKLFGQGATSTNLQYIKSGLEEGSIAFPYYEDLFADIDALARQAAGVPIAAPFSTPVWIQTQSSVPANTSALNPIVPSVAEIFENLWKSQ
jgi:ribose transport system substrate-binding protein